MSLTVSGESIVLLNSLGVQGKRMSPTQYECIHRESLSTHININFLSIHIGPGTTARLLYTFSHIYTYIYTHTFTPSLTGERRNCHCLDCKAV